MISAPNPIVIDTSVLISSALFPNSTPDQATILAFELFDVVVSAALLDELLDALTRPKHEQYASIAMRLTYIDAFKDNAEAIEITTSIKACRDANDDKVLELAVSAKAPIIISGDKDLLTMSPFRGIELLSPRQFLAEFS